MIYITPDLILCLVKIFNKMINIPIEFKYNYPTKNIRRRIGEHLFCKIIKSDKKQKKIFSEDLNEKHKKASIEGDVLICPFGPQNYTRSVVFKERVLGSFSIGPFILENEKKNCNKIFNKFINSNDFNPDLNSSFKKGYNKILVLSNEKFNKDIKEQLSLLINFLKDILNSQTEQRIWGVFQEGEPEGLAHQIYTPIQAIIATAENIYNASTDYELQDTTSTIISQLSSLKNLVDDARQNIEQSIQESLMTSSYISFENNDILQIINEVINTLRSEAKKKGVDINLIIKKIYTEEIIIQMESDFIRNVLYNLIGNAVKYSFYGKSLHRYIDVIIEPLNLIYGNYNKIQITITNFGVGIKGDELNQILSQKERGDFATTERGSGLGIGLFQTKKFIELHKGKFSIVSVPPSELSYVTITHRIPHKTTVTVVLPVNQPKEKIKREFSYSTHRKNIESALNLFSNHTNIISAYYTDKSNVWGKKKDGKKLTGFCRLVRENFEKHRI